MTTKTATKTLDCIALKRKAQERVYRMTRDMTDRERLAWFRQRAETGRLGDWWKSLSRPGTSGERTREDNSPV